MDLYLVLYLVLILVYRFAETWVMAKFGTLPRRPAKDWTAWMIIVPYWLVIVAPVLEYVAGERQRPSTSALTAGAALFIAATAVRVRAHLDLGAQFSMFLETGRSEGLVTTGLYAWIRHPLYLANLLLFLACPTFLAVRWSWLSTAVAFVGVVTRIEIEETLLRERFDGYAEYAEGTWKLVPRLY